MAAKRKIRLGILDILILALVALKLLGIIDWSWWLVLLPGLIAFAIGFILGVRDAIERRRARRDPFGQLLLAYQRGLLIR